MEEKTEQITDEFEQEELTELPATAEEIEEPVETAELIETMEDGQKLLRISVLPEDTGERADKILSRRCKRLSRSYVAQLAQEDRITSAGRKVGKKHLIKDGEVFEVLLPPPKPISMEPENIPLDIVYEDEDLIVVNKPQGLVVHPAPGNESGTLVNALLYHCSGQLSAMNGVVRPGIVHRIDKDTSGLLVVAKNDTAHRSLAAQLKEHKALRQYWALATGTFSEDSGTIDKPLGRHPVNRKRRAVVEGGREAITHWRVLERFHRYTLVECTLETGRTHQIRVHMMSMSHSLVGDPVYGVKKERFPLTGQLLHAKTIGFVHPRTGEQMEFHSELPEHFMNILKILRAEQ